MKAFLNIFKVPELRKRVIFTLFALVVFRVGAALPVPGIDPIALAEAFRAMRGAGGLMEFFNLFSGGALKNFALFALGVMPYISALIIMQLLTVVIPSLERLSKEGMEGRRKIQQYSRLLTIPIAMIQAYGLTFTLRSLHAQFPQIYPDTTGFYLLFVLSVTAGTIFLMWLGEQITERGVGNGISVLIMAGIVARFPAAIFQTFTLAGEGEQLDPISLIIVFTLFLVVIGLVVWEEQGMRKIPVQYAKKVVGRKVYGSQVTYLPFKVNPTGVIPIIFASAVMMFPVQIAQWFGSGGLIGNILSKFTPGSSLYLAIYIILVVLFAYFYTSIQFNPKDIAENLKKYGGFIPGIRPGKATEDYLNYVLNRITLPGSLFIGVIAILPYIVLNIFNIPSRLAYLMGGTSLLIMVGVALDTLTQIESDLVMHHYPGFLKHGKIKDRGTRYV